MSENDFFASDNSFGKDNKDSSLKDNEVDLSNPILNILLELKYTVFKRKWWFALTVFIFSAFGYKWVMAQPKFYRASSKVFISGHDFSPLGKKNQIMIKSDNYETRKAYFSTLIEDLVSRNNVKNFIRGAHFSKNQMVINYCKLNKQKGINLTLLTSCLRGGLSIKKLISKNIIRVNHISRSPDISALVANEFARFIVNYNLKSKVKPIQKASSFLENRVLEFETKLNLSEKNLFDFREKNQLFESTMVDKQNLLSDLIGKYSQQRSLAKLELIEIQNKRSLLKRVTGGKKTTIKVISTLPSNLINSRLKTALTEWYSLKIKFDILGMKYKSQHPIYKETKLKLNKTSNRILSSYRDLEKSLQIQELSHKNKIANYNSELVNLKKNAYRVNRLQIMHNKLKRDLKNNEELLTILIKKHKETQISHVNEHNNMKVLENATAPRGHYKPNYRTNLMITLLLSLLLGILVAFIREYLENTLRSLEEAERKLQAKIFLAFPDLELLKENKDKEHLKIAEKETRDRKYPEMILLKKPKGRVAEMLRVLRTNLMFSMNQKGNNTFLVTSPIPKEGKSYFAANLASVLAFEKNTLLVDCDLRRPSQHKIWKDVNDFGLIDYLSGNMTLDEITRDCDIPNLSLIFSGSKPSHPAELITSKVFIDFMDTVKEKYDRVVIDSPPALIVSDPLVLTKYADMILFVLQLGLTPKNGLNHIYKSFKNAAPQIKKGIIINKFRGDKSSNTNYDSGKYGGYGYYSKGYYGYSYGYTYYDGGYYDSEDDSSKEDDAKKKEEDTKKKEASRI